MTQNKIDAKNAFVQFVSTSTSSAITCNTTIPADDSIPQITEGTSVLSLSITPKFLNSTLEIMFTGCSQKDGNTGFITVALFQDSNANAIAAKCFATLGTDGTHFALQYIMTSGTTSSTTFSIRVGPNTNVCYINANSVGTRIYGGVASTLLTITERL